MGKIYPTSQYLSMNPMVNRPKEQPTLWCDFDKKWDNHMIEECYNCIQFMRGQAMGGMPKVTTKGERPMPMLEKQPPLPRIAPVRLVAQEDDKEPQKGISANDALWRRKKILPKGRGTWMDEKQPHEQLGATIQHGL